MARVVYIRQALHMARMGHRYVELMPAGAWHLAQGECDKIDASIKIISLAVPTSSSCVSFAEPETRRHNSCRQSLGVRPKISCLGLGLLLRMPHKSYDLICVGRQIHSCSRKPEDSRGTRLQSVPVECLVSMSLMLVWFGSTQQFSGTKPSFYAFFQHFLMCQALCKGLTQFRNGVGQDVFNVDQPDFQQANCWASQGELKISDEQIRKGWSMCPPHWRVNEQLLGVQHLPLYIILYMNTNT